MISIPLRNLRKRNSNPCITRQLNLKEPTIYIATGQVYYPITQVQMHAYGLHYLSPY